MQYEINYQGAYPVLDVTLAAGDTLVSEAGALDWMDTTVE